jgi:hypothetical protein
MKSASFTVPPPEYKPSGYDLAWARREDLADRVILAVGAAFSKLAEHKKEIRELWAAFDNLQPGEMIKGCTTKTEFAQQHLHRTPRAIRYMLRGGNTTRSKAPRTRASLVSLLTSKLVRCLRSGGASEPACQELKQAIEKAFAPRPSLWNRVTSRLALAKVA